jgi:1-acyl-sn-glycerol-3-phosphate acyltransferase
VALFELPHVPELGPNLQRAHSRFAAWLGRVSMGLSGWRFEGEVPDVPKLVLIVAPHTSNWDFLVGLQGKLALRLGGTFIGKHTLFRWPLGIVMRWLGGIPVNRGAAAGFASEVARVMKGARQMTVVLAPEGTRKLIPQWKSGFYRIAVEAGAPILPVGFDYTRKVVFFAPLFHPTGDYEKDLPLLRAHYRAEMGKKPENYAG